MQSKNWFRLPLAEIDTITYNLDSKGADSLLISKQMIENKQWDGKFEEIKINGKSQTFSDGLIIEVPLSSPNTEVSFTSKDMGTLPFRCFKMELKKSDGSLTQIVTEPPRLLYFDLSLNIRTTTWSKFIEVIKERPITGHGQCQERRVYIPERDIYYEDTHNMMIGTTVRGGLVALGLWMIFIGRSFLGSLKIQTSFAVRSSFCRICIYSF